MDSPTDITSLANLSPIEYDHCREAAANTLKVRVATLDRMVKAARGKLQSDTEGQGRAITFESVDEWSEPVDGAVLLDELAVMAARYLVLPAHGPRVLALWTILTWLAPQVTVLPLLAITSPEKGCGKTTVLEYLRRLCYRARSTSNISAAALFRFVEKYSPTLLIDEADSFLRDNEEMRGILNSGHTRTSAYVIRTTGEDHEPREFSTWCPKAIAGIGRLPDTIMDRSICLAMRRKGPGESIMPMPEDDADFSALRRKVARWAADNGEAIAGSRPALPTGVENRQADNWRVLLAIADAAEANWPDLARAACRTAVAANGEDNSLRVSLLSDMRTILGTRGTDKLPTEEAIKDLAAMAERPWTECNKGKIISPRQLSRWLGEFGIRSRDIRPEGQKNCKGYQREDFDDAFRRYLPPIYPRHRDNGSTTPVSVATDPRQQAEVVTPINSLKPSNGADCHVVTDENTPTAGNDDARVAAAALSAGISPGLLRANLTASDLEDQDLDLVAYGKMIVAELEESE